MIEINLAPEQDYENPEDYYASLEYYEKLMDWINAPYYQDDRI